MHSDAHAREQSDGIRWFIGMGVVAVLFSIFLATVDQRLSESDSERRLGATLRELRIAQHSLNSRATDARQTQGYLHVPAPQAQAAQDNHAAHSSGH